MKSNGRELHLPPYLEGVVRGFEIQLGALGIRWSRPNRPMRHNNYTGPTANELLDDLRQSSEHSSEKPFVLRVPDRTLIDLSRAFNGGPWLTQQHFLDSLPGTGRFAGVLVGNRDCPMRIPVANIVHAPDFVSWEAGLGAGKPKVLADGTPQDSRKLIRQYARAANLPPLERTVALVQPNGLVVYSVDEGRHRAAAAMRRGDPFIETEVIAVCQLAEDVIPLPATLPQAGGQPLEMTTQM